MPIQAPQWTDYLNCPACCREFSPRRSPVSLSCGHTLCRPCLKNLIRKQCPFDQSVISMDLEELAVNTALLQLMGYDPPTQPSHPSSIQSLSEQDRRAYDVIVKSLEQLAVFLKYCCTASVNMIGSRLSRPMQRKLVTLLQCSLMDEEGRGKAARAARSLGERTVSELILQHQNPQQLSANLWAAVRSRGCQFLGPAMQEEVLKLVLLALEDGSPLSRKVLVMFVVQRLEPHFPQASKTSIGHVVQLLYRASCFMVSKRESDSSLMQLKEEFRTYECLRREHDSQIVQIATESGLRIAPDQWSALLYGDTLHKSHMQSIIDKLQTPHTFAQSVQELCFALKRTGDPAQLLSMSISLDRLTNIDPSPEAKSPSWQELSQIMTALKDVVSGLVDYMQHHAAARDANHNLKTDRLPDATTQPATISSLNPGRYKVAMCRDAQTRTFCPRGNNCTYAHTEEELERYRRQDNMMPYSKSPQDMTPPPPPIPMPMFNYPPPRVDDNYTRMLMQQASVRQGAVPDEFGLERAPRRPSFEHHQLDRPPLPYSDSNRSYANVLVYGGANNGQLPNRNGHGSPPDLRHPNGGLSTPDGVIRHPNEGMNQLNVKMTQHGPVINPLGAPMNHHLGGIISPLNGCICPVNPGVNLLNGRFVVLGERIVVLNDSIVVFNDNIGQYSRSLSPLDDAGNHINGGLPPNHQPPTDSRYFPRQPSDKPAYFHPQNDMARMGGMPAYQGMGAIGAEYNLPPDFSLRQFGDNDSSERPNIESFGFRADPMSRFETAWQSAPPPAIDDLPRQNMFRFNNRVKNLPEGINPYVELPMGVNLTHMQPQPYMDLENQHIGPNYPSNSMNYEQPIQHHMPSMLDVPATSDTTNESMRKNEYSELATNAVLDDLHNLAVRVTSECSDDEKE